MKRVETSKHWGVDEYAGRSAIIYYVNDKYYEVELYTNDTLKETLVMKTEDGDEVYFHSEVYADNCAENYCLGYMR